MKKFIYIIYCMFLGILSAETLEITYNTATDIAGFQFDVEGVTLLGVSGGDAEEAGFTVSTGGSTVLGFSFTGAIIPAGSGVLTILEVEGVLSEACIANVVISDTDGAQIETNNDCSNIEEPQPEIGTIEILYSMSDDIAGFQFDVEGVTLLGVSGGDAEEAGFTVSTGGSTVLGFSFTGAIIPAGSGVLTILEVEGVLSEACITNVVISDTDGAQLETNNDCTAISQPIAGCTDSSACNYDANATEDDGSCDYGTECWDGSFACDENDCPDVPLGTVEINFSTVTDIAGFQFDVEGVTITGANGGAAEDAGFTVSTGGSTVLGFSFSGAVIPAGTDILTILDVEGDIEAACITNVVLSDSSSDQLVTSNDCTTITESIPGCMDETACNYDPSANIDDGSCLELDCEGECGGDAIEDCNGECSGSASIDQCDICSGGSTGIDECFRMSINYVSDTPIAGFQFDVEGVTVTGVGGGAAEAAGFLLSFNENTILGAFLSGTTISAGSGTLVEVDFTGDSNLFCLSNTIFSDSFGDGLTSEVENCTTINITEAAILGCTNVMACNYNADATEDDGSCLFDDCTGECGGTAVIDECGVCDGPGAIYECGCIDIEEGFCDCYGNTLDACFVCGGPGDVYECGCYDIPDNECDCNGSVNDCNGECGGNAIIDCAGECGGSAVLDDCGECGGDNSSCNDCAGVANGDAELDDCGVCSGGTSNHEYNSDIDCNNDCFGSAFVDGCGICVGGNTGLDACPNDCAGNFNLGDGSNAYFDDCFDCICGSLPPVEGFSCLEEENINMACNGICYDFDLLGTGIDGKGTDECGVCAGGNESCWYVNVSANINGTGWNNSAAQDSINRLGMHPNALDDYFSEWDTICGTCYSDVPETQIMAPDNYIALYYPHPEWQGHPDLPPIFGTNFTQDIRSYIDFATNDDMDIMEWTFVVQSDINGTVNLNFDFITTSDDTTGVGHNSVFIKRNNVFEPVYEDIPYQYFHSSVSVDTFKIIVGNALPEAPQAQIAEPGNRQIILRWEDPTSTTETTFPSDEFIIYEYIASEADFVPIGTSSDAEFVRTMLPTYEQQPQGRRFKVSGRNEVGEGPKSAEFSSSTLENQTPIADAGQNQYYYDIHSEFGTAPVPIVLPRTASWEFKNESYDPDNIFYDEPTDMFFEEYENDLNYQNLGYAWRMNQVVISDSAEFVYETGIPRNTYCVGGDGTIDNEIECAVENGYGWTEDPAIITLTVNDWESENDVDNIFIYVKELPAPAKVVRVDIDNSELYSMSISWKESQFVFPDDADENGVFDGDDWVDLNGNGDCDPGEEIIDVNDNGVCDPVSTWPIHFGPAYDESESWIDENLDQEYNSGEYYEDINKNDLYDYHNSKLAVYYRLWRINPDSDESYPLGEIDSETGVYEDGSLHMSYTFIDNGDDNAGNILETTEYCYYIESFNFQGYRSISEEFCSISASVPSVAINYPNGGEILPHDADTFYVDLSYVNHSYLETLDLYLQITNSQGNFETVDPIYSGEPLNQLAIPAVSSDFNLPNWFEERIEGDLNNTVKLRAVVTEFDPPGEAQEPEDYEAVSDNPFIVGLGKYNIDLEPGFHLLSSPLNLDNDFLDDLFGFPTFGFQCCDANGNYEMSDLEQANSGDGFYLLLTSDEQFEFNGDVLLNHEYEINAGWNLVGNPLIGSISVDELVILYEDITYSWQEAAASRVISPVPIIFDNGIATHIGVDKIDPVEGFWVHSQNDGVNISFNPHPFIEEESSELNMKEISWKIYFRAREQNGSAYSYGSEVMIGIDYNSENSFIYGEDQYSTPLVPQLSRYAKLFINKSDWFGSCVDEICVGGSTPDAECNIDEDCPAVSDESYGIALEDSLFYRDIRSSSNSDTAWVWNLLGDPLNISGGSDIALSWSIIGDSEHIEPFNFYWKDNLDSESNGYDLIDLEGTEIAIDQNDYEAMEIRVELKEGYFGCTDDSQNDAGEYLACNYVTSNELCTDGLCLGGDPLDYCDYLCVGCMDPHATNFDRDYTTEPEEDVCIYDLGLFAPYDTAAYPLEEIDIPIHLTNPDSLEILGIDFVLTYDPNIIIINDLDYSIAGLANYTVFTNADTDSTFSVGMFYDGAGEIYMGDEIDGVADPIMNLKAVVGTQINNFTYIEIQDVLINGIPSHGNNCKFEIQQGLFEVSGNVSYYKEAHPISDVDLNLTGMTEYSNEVVDVNTTTSDSGSFTFASVPRGNNYDLTVLPKTSDLQGLSSLDASIISRYSTGNDSLVDNEDLDNFIKAANVNLSFHCIDSLCFTDQYEDATFPDIEDEQECEEAGGNWNDEDTEFEDEQECEEAGYFWEPSITSTDASRIAQYIVGLIDSLNTEGVEWLFLEQITPLGNVFDTIANVNIDGIRLGDVTGDWSPATELARSDYNNYPSIELSYGDIIKLPIIINNSENVEGFDFELKYDSNAFKLIDYYDEGGIFNVSNYNTIFNKQSPGIFKLATYAISNPNNYEGLIGFVEFEVITSIVEQSELFIELMNINEQSVVGGLEIMIDGESEKLISDGILFTLNPLPARYALYQNYPNPFNPKTTIRFDLPCESYVQLKIFDVQGRVVETLLNGNINAGYHQIKWDGSRASSGMYFIQMIADESRYIKTSKMILLK